MIAYARRCALDVLLQVDRQRAYSNLALQAAFRKARGARRDRALCTHIVYGTLQRRRTLDAALALRCSRPLAELDLAVLTALRMAAYQLLYLDKVPAYAVINDAVALCKELWPPAAGLVNAVLRSLARAGSDALRQVHDVAENACSWAEGAGLLHSCPTWLAQSWGNQFGRQRALAMLSACNQTPSLSLRVNRRRASVADVQARLFDELQVESSCSRLSPAGIRLSRGLDLQECEPYLDGSATAQDEAAMLIAPLLQPAAHLRIADLCAAPGGKTTHIAELQDDAGEISAFDIHPHKLPLIRNNAERLGLQSIRTQALDARTLPGRSPQDDGYDAILLDAPCSGLGVLRRRPEIRWQRTAADCLALASVQQELLRAACQLVRPGGVIVYSTCTLLAQENEQVLAAVESEYPHQLLRDDLSRELAPALCDGGATPCHALTLTPDQFGTDGFFVARLRKSLST